MKLTAFVVLVVGSIVGSNAALAATADDTKWIGLSAFLDLFF